MSDWRLIGSTTFVAVRTGIDKPIAISTYELTRALPSSLQSALPTVEQIESELAESEPSVKPVKPPRKKPGGRSRD